jgi:hypothetical protein
VAEAKHQARAEVQAAKVRKTNRFWARKEANRAKGGGRWKWNRAASAAPAPNVDQEVGAPAASQPLDVEMPDVDASAAEQLPPPASPPQPAAALSPG